MTTHSATTNEQAGLTDRYVHATTQGLPADQRADIAEELRGTIADRVDALRASGDLTATDAEYAAIEELGDPARLAAGYIGKRLQLIGPELYPSYTRVLKSVLYTAVPGITLIIAVISALDGDSFGSVIGGAVWMAFTVTLQVAFWVTLAFALVERGIATDDLRSSLGVEWKPERLPELPSRPRGSVGELVASLVWLAIIAAALVWQQFRSPIGDSLPMLDPDLWSFWLPLVLVLLLVEGIFEVVKYRTAGWSPGWRP